MHFRSNDTATTEIYTVRNTLSLHDALPILWPNQSVRTPPVAFSQEIGCTSMAPQPAASTNV